ncbi:MAG: hypothetical protein IJT51_07605 [Bacteroidales bacterium]|nr:hypothetical protein [Bacteroidales bacterium]
MIDSLFEKFKSLKVLVVGDVMIDAYLTGGVSRISPEAPVPIVEIRKRSYRIGGAANVAMNIRALGAEPILCSVVGRDDKGSLLAGLMKENDLSQEGICLSDKRKTTIKYRIIGNKAQMLRIDDEDTAELSVDEQSELLARIGKIIGEGKVDAVVFEDYDKGVLSKTVIDGIMGMAKKHDIIVTVDPKKRNFNNYSGADLFKPNLKELQEGLDNRSEVLSLDEIERLMREFAETMHVSKMMTTLSERGIAVYDLEKHLFFSQPAFLRRISDVSGAGDTVISVATLCLAAGLPADKMAVISNLAGGIVCEFAGVVPIEAEVLKSHVRKELDGSIIFE